MNCKFRPDSILILQQTLCHQQQHHLTVFILGFKQVTMVNCKLPPRRQHIYNITLFRH